MPIPAALGAAMISGGANLLGGLLGSAGAANLNRKNMLFQANMLAAQQQYNDSVIQRQQDYNDKINAQNFAWNDPANIRARLENAGYNPYLRGNETSGAAQSASFGTGTSAMPTGGTLNPLGSLSESVSSLGNLPTTFYAAQAAKTQNDILQTQKDAASYSLNKQKDNDSVSLGGVSAYYGDALQQIVSIRNACSVANQNAIKASVDKMQLDFYNSPAYDENGQPVVDENGNSVNNFDAQNNEATKAAFANVQRLLTDIQKGKVDIEKVKVDTLIAKYNLDHILPQQLKNLKMELNKLQSDIALNYAQADSARASAFASIQAGLYSGSLRATENALRPFKVSSSRYGSLVDSFNYQTKAAEFNSDRAYRQMIQSPQYYHVKNGFRYVGDILGGLTSPVIGSVTSLLK